MRYEADLARRLERALELLVSQRHSGRHLHDEELAAAVQHRELAEVVDVVGAERDRFAAADLALEEAHRAK